MMEMSLKQSTLVLLTVAVVVMAISDQVTISLDEEQKIRKVPFGSNLTLTCNMMTNTKKERFRVSWFFNSSEPTFNNTTQELPMEAFHKSTNTSAEASINRDQETLLNVTYKNSGWYFCKMTVEIPFFNWSKSEATQVVVVKTVTENTTYKSQVPVSPTNPPLFDEWWMWIVLGVSVLILIVLLIICVLMKRRLRRRRASECPVYANTRPTPSPRPGTSASNLKTVYSSQNPRTPSPGRYEEGKRKYRQ